MQFRESRSLRWIAAAVLIGPLWPIRSLSAPTWDFYVTNESHRPLSHTLVRESHQNFPPNWMATKKISIQMTRGMSNSYLNGFVRLP
jgi:hypothetical protein